MEKIMNEYWVASIVLNHYGQVFLKYIHVKDGFAVSSDGRRIHKAPTDRDNGIYNEFMKLTIDEKHLLEGSKIFTKMAQIVYDEGKIEADPSKLQTNDLETGFELIDYYTIEEMHFNRDYIDEASFLRPFKYQASDDRRSIKITNCFNNEAIVMSLNPEKVPSNDIH